jgi:chitin disaccharide deacetylase
MIPVALCADDYALAPGVDEGILALADKGRISALSCMTASKRWPEAARALRPLFGRVEIGLHFTLTQLSPLGLMPKLAPDGRFPEMGALYRQAFLRMIDREEIAAELGLQLRAFSKATGREPDFLDGHHHVHQLPTVREIVAQQWGKRPGWIRNTAAGFGAVLSYGAAIPRAAVLAVIGHAAARTWRGAGIATNADFSGVRNFDPREPFPAMMRAFLKNARPGLLIMCHPGRQDAAEDRLDYSFATREAEFDYLSGPDFTADLNAAGCVLAPLSATVQQPRSAAG